MKTILTPPLLGTLLSLLLLCSCATENSIHSQLPADVTMNKGAGRGDELFVTLHLDDGEELPFIVDTGASFTILDKSLEPKLGTCLWKHRLWHVRYGMKTVKLFTSPRLYLGDTQLPTGWWICTADLSAVSKEMNRLTHLNRKVMGVLGMDCLKHFRIQLDFAADRMRFLDPHPLKQEDWGKAFPLTSLRGCFSVHGNLMGLKSPGSLIDTGCSFDGWLTPKLFQRWTNHAIPPAVAEARSTNAVLGGENYPETDLGETHEFNFNGIGLQFLARHLVTFDFPNRVMYLKRTSIGPLIDEESLAAVEFLKNLRGKGQLPGWSKEDKGQIYPQAYPIANTLGAQKNGDPTIYFYTVIRASNESPWKLQKAWRTDQTGRTLEEYPVP